MLLPKALFDDETHSEVLLFFFVLFIGIVLSELLRGWKVLPLSWLLPGLRQSHRIFLLLVGIPISLLIALLYVKQAELFGVSYFFMSISLCLCLFYLHSLIWYYNKLKILSVILGFIVYFMCFFKPSLIHQILVKYPLPIILLSMLFLFQSIRVMTNRRLHAKAVNTPSPTLFDNWNQEKMLKYAHKRQVEKIAKKGDTYNFWIKYASVSSPYSLLKAITGRFLELYGVLSLKAWLLGFCGFPFLLIMICSYLTRPAFPVGYSILGFMIPFFFIMHALGLNQKEPHMYLPVSRRQKYLSNILLQFLLIAAGCTLIGIMLVSCNLLSPYLPPIFLKGRLWESNPLPQIFALIPMCVFPYVNAWVTLLRKKGLPYGFMAAYLFFIIVAGVIAFTLWEFYGEDAFCIIKAYGGRVFIMSIVMSIVPLWLINIWLVKRKYLNKDYLL